MSIRDQLRAARAKAGLSQESIPGWDRGHVSKFEHGKRGAHIDKLEAWVAACGMELVAVPIGAADPRELAALPEADRELVLQLSRLLPHLSRENRRTLAGLVQMWTEDQPPETSATIQDSRASIS